MGIPSCAHSRLGNVKNVITQPEAVALSSAGSATVARLVVVGPLDGQAGATLKDYCDRGITGELARLEVDLTGVTRATREGVAALAGCLLNRRNFSDGVGVVVSNEVGRRALLESRAEA
jgi:hypothetical protein